MELIKKYYQKIIAYGLIVLGIILLPIFFFLHLKLSSYWCTIFFITVGLTLIPLVENKK